MRRCKCLFKLNKTQLFRQILSLRQKERPFYSYAQVQWRASTRIREPPGVRLKAGEEQAAGARALQIQGRCWEGLARDFRPCL